MVFGEPPLASTVWTAMTLRYLVLAPILFLIGAIPSAHLIARRRGIGDLRDIGSRNVGASNIARLAGRKWGAVTLVADALKAFVPIALLRGFGIIREIDILWIGVLLLLGRTGRRGYSLVGVG